MNKNKKQKKVNLLEGKGFYIALCCCIVMIASIAYAGRSISKPNNVAQKASDSVEVVDTPTKTIVPIITATQTPTQKPNATTSPKSKEVSTAKVVQKTTSTIQPTAKPVDVTFVSPVLGVVLTTFSDGALVYNKDLDDWRAHNGVDLKAEIGTDVVASADGMVVETGTGTLGNYIIISHQDGFKTVYANLTDEQIVTIDKEVKQGDVIGKIGDTAISELFIDSHLHFEVSKHGEYANPMSLLK